MIHLQRNMNLALNFRVVINSLNGYPMILPTQVFEIFSPDGNFTQNKILRSVSCVEQIKGQMTESSGDLKVNFFGEEGTVSSIVVAGFKQIDKKK